MCDDGVCNIPGGLEVPDTVGPGRPARTDFARGFIQIGFSLGMSQVSAGMVTDGGPPGGLTFLEDGVTVARNTDGDVIAPNVYNPDGTLKQDTPWVADADSWERNPDWVEGMPLEEQFRPNPNDECSADGTVSGPNPEAFNEAGYPLLPTRYCARVNASGFVLSPAMRVNIGYFVLPRLSVAALLRYQFSAGEGTLANILLGGRAEYLFIGGNSATGFGFSSFLGVTGGQIQPQPPPEGSGQTAPYLISGMIGSHVGFNFRYRFHRNFGLALAPELDLQFPNFLLHIDTTLSAEAAF
jgi:hypothetical protein